MRRYNWKLDLFLFLISVAIILIWLWAAIESADNGGILDNKK